MVVLVKIGSSLMAKTKKIISTVAIILLSQGAFAASTTAVKGKFKKFSSLSSEEKAVYSKAHKAQFRIRVSEGPNCTGTYISNKGHGLTASHCIKRCMPWPSKLGLKSWPVEANDIKGKHSRHKVSANPWLYPQICTAVIDGEEKTIEVIAGSKGMKSESMPIDVVFYFKQYYFIVQEEVDSFKDKWLSAFYNGWGMGGDYAIFKTLDQKSDEKTSCLSISKSETFGGEHYSLSYPGKTSLDAEELNSDLHLSVGGVYQGNYFNSEVIAINDVDQLYLNSNLWAYPGSSGASLVNPKDNSISGVLSAVVGREGIKGEELPDARFISSKLIRKQAGDVLKQISCSP